MGRFLGLNILGTLDAGENVGLVSTLATGEPEPTDIAVAPSGI